jgi:protein-disulfide isomerase/uncharacterized membrane protein
MTETTKQKTFNTSKIYPVIGLSLIGAIISVWQTRLFFNTRGGMASFHSFCNIGQTFDCTAIEMSKYSEIFGGFPLSALAVSGYLLIFILAFYGLSESSKRNVRQLLVVFTGIALLFSVVYLGIMVALIGKLCLMCLGVDAVNVLLFICALRLPKPSENDHDPSTGVSVVQVLGAGAVAVIIAVLLGKGMDPQSEMKKDDINDIVENVFSAPTTDITIPADAPVVGNPNAKVTVIKFSDYQCPACKMGATAIHPLFKRYPNDVKFVFINFPLATECNPDPGLKRTIHEFACEAASVAVCATEQGHFLETYETLFEHQADFTAGNIADLVASHVPGLDLAKLKECAQLPSTLAKLKRDAELGMSVKIVSTPTFFANGKKIEGGLPTSIWIQILDRMTK